MATIYNIKQLLMDKVIKTRIFKVIKVPQEPVQKIINSIHKIEVEGVNLKGTNLGLDLKVSLHIIYIPQGIGEFKQTISVSFNFFQELIIDDSGEFAYPQVTAKIDRLVMIPRGKNLQVLINIATEVLVMGFNKCMVLEDRKIIENWEDGHTIAKPLKKPVFIAIDDVDILGDFSIKKFFEVPLEENNSWQLVEVYPEGISFSYVLKETQVEIYFKVLTRITGYREGNQKLQSQYKLLEFSIQKTIEGWESQRGLVIEPHFYTIGLREQNNGISVISVNVDFTLLSTKPKLLKANLKQLAIESNQLLLEKPILRRREVVKIEREILIESSSCQLRPEVFVSLVKEDSKGLKGVVCLKIGDSTWEKAVKEIEYIPFQAECTYINPNHITLLKSKVKIEKIEKLSKSRLKLYIWVIVEILGSEIITISP